MRNFFSLLIFNILIGHSTALKTLLRELGWRRALKVISRVSVQTVRNNPFKALNAKNKDISWQEKNSQRQILPALHLYDALLVSGFDGDEALKIVEKVVFSVARRYLRFTVPVIDDAALAQHSQQDRVNVFAKLVSRFDNVIGKLTNDGNDRFDLTVNQCYFSQYSHQLGYPQLASVFCKADQEYFDQFQPCVDLVRTKTLAQDGKACDFSFRIIAKG